MVCSKGGGSSNASAGFAASTFTSTSCFNGAPDFFSLSFFDFFSFPAPTDAPDALLRRTK
jgi:hypothetical protein